MIEFFLKRLVIALLAANSAGDLLAGTLGLWGLLPAFFVGVWLGNELFSEARGDAA